MRDGGERSSIDAAQLVPGDVIAVKSGDRLPADVRLLQVSNLQVLEAMLTGESVPVSKNTRAVDSAAGIGDRKCMAFSATAVAAGQALCVVVETGDRAEIGKISKLVSEVKSTKTNLVVQMEVLGRWLACIVLLIALTAFLLAHLRAHESFADAFESAVAIAVAMVPEGLPALVTIVLALGTKKMADRNAIIRQLPCVEVRVVFLLLLFFVSGCFVFAFAFVPSPAVCCVLLPPSLFFLSLTPWKKRINAKKTLGSLTVICSDKTGERAVLCVFCFFSKRLAVRALLPPTALTPLSS